MLDPTENNFTSNSDLPILDKSEQEICDITCKELGQALKDLAIMARHQVLIDSPPIFTNVFARYEDAF